MCSINSLSWAQQDVTQTILRSMQGKDCLMSDTADTVIDVLMYSPDGQCLKRLKCASEKFTFFYIMSGQSSGHLKAPRDSFRKETQNL